MKSLYDSPNTDILTSTEAPHSLVPHPPFSDEQQEQALALLETNCRTSIKEQAPTLIRDALRHGKDHVLIALHVLGINMLEGNGLLHPGMEAIKTGHTHTLETLYECEVSASHLLEAEEQEAQQTQIIRNYELVASWAAFHGSTAVLEMLHHKGININAPCESGMTPAESAALTGNADILNTFAELGVSYNIDGFSTLSAFKKQKKN